MYQINSIIQNFQPLAIFIGGSQGCKMTLPSSDIDIVILLDKNKYEYCNKHDFIYHYISSTIEMTINETGLLFMENIIYCQNSKVYLWLQKNMYLLNVLHIINNKCFQEEYYSTADAYKIIAFYNYYYNKNKLLNIRESDCQYHEEYEQIIKQLKTDFTKITINKEQLIENFYDCVRGEE